MKYTCRETQGGFLVEIEYEKQNETVEFTYKVTENYTEATEKDTEKVTSVQKTILQEISNNKFVTIPDLSEKLKINIRNTKSNLSKLKAKGLIERIGPDKGGHWKIIK